MAHRMISAATYSS